MNLKITHRPSGCAGRNRWLCALLWAAAWAGPAWAQPLTAPQPRPMQASDPGLPISVQFHHTEVRTVLQVFADFTGLNFVSTEAVSGQISVRLKDVPWPQALHVVLQAKGLEARKDGQVVWVAPQNEWLQREKKWLEAQAGLEAVSPLHTLSVRLKHARASEVAQRLQGASLGGQGAGTARWLSARGSVMADPRTNQILLSDVPLRLGQVQQMLQTLDVPVQQVLIEARIVEADDQFGAALGVRWGLGLTRSAQINGQTQNLAQVGASNAPGVGTLPGNQVALPAGMAGQALVQPASMAVSLFNATADRFINLELSALEAEGRGKVVSRPRVITSDQTKALIEQGTELPYQTGQATGGSTLTQITFRKANLKLEVTPHITPEGAVVLDVDVNRDSVGQLTAAGYAINTKHVKTQVKVADGGTVVLGGIYEDTQKNDEAKVPGLGDLPLLGWLFRNQQKVQRRSELLVFLTPRILSDTLATPSVSSSASASASAELAPPSATPLPQPTLAPSLPPSPPPVPAQ